MCIRDRYSPRARLVSDYYCGLFRNRTGYSLNFSLFAFDLDLSIFGSIVLETISIILEKTIYLSAPVALCNLPVSIVSFLSEFEGVNAAGKRHGSLLSFSNENMFTYSFQI